MQTLVFVIPKNASSPKKYAKRINYLYFEKKLAEIFHLVLLIILFRLSFLSYSSIKYFSVVSEGMCINTLTTNGEL